MDWGCSRSRLIRGNDFDSGSSEAMMLVDRVVVHGPGLPKGDVRR